MLATNINHVKINIDKVTVLKMSDNYVIVWISGQLDEPCFEDADCTYPMKCHEEQCTCPIGTKPYTLSLPLYTRPKCVPDFGK